MVKEENYLSINEEKKEEVLQEIFMLLEKENKTQNEKARLEVLCMLGFGRDSKQLMSFVKDIESQIPEDVKEDGDLIKEEIEKILDKLDKGK